MTGLSSHGGDAISWGRHGQSFMNQSQKAFGGHISYRSDYAIDLKFQYRYSNLAADDQELIRKEKYGKEHSIRNFQYRTAIHEISFIGIYEIESLKIEKRRLIGTITPYLYGGFGLAFLNDHEEHRSWGSPKEENLLNIQLDQEQGSKGGFQLPVGVGINYMLNDKFGINIFYSARVAISDYLDGISESANPDKNDAYQFCGFEFLYRI